MAYRERRHLYYWDDRAHLYRPDDRAKVFRRKRIVVRRGLDAKGNKVHLTEVVEEGSALDDDWDIDWEKDPNLHGEQA